MVKAALKSGSAWRRVSFVFPSGSAHSSGKLDAFPPAFERGFAEWVFPLFGSRAEDDRLMSPPMVGALPGYLVVAGGALACE